MYSSEGEKTISIKGGCLDRLKDLSGAVYIWCEDAIVKIPDGVERYEKEPPGGASILRGTTVE